MSLCCLAGQTSLALVLECIISFNCCQDKILLVMQAQQLSESLLFGWPNILIPHADSFDSVDDMQLNEQSLAGLCQVSRDTSSAVHASSYICSLLCLGLVCDLTLSAATYIRWIRMTQHQTGWRQLFAPVRT